MATERSRPVRVAVLMRPLLVAVVMAISAVPALAQRPDLPPAAPDSVLAPGPTGVGFLEWRMRVAERGRVGASYLVDGPRYQLLVMTPMAIDALRQDSLIVKATKGCQKAIRLSDADVQASAMIDPWAAFDSAARARPLVAIAIYPKEQRRYDCHAGVLARFAAMSRGALYGAFGAAVEQEQVATAELRRDGLVEPTPLTGRAPVIKVTQGRLMEDGSGQVRLWVDPLAFSPDAEGRVPQLEVHVFNPVDPEPDVLPLPDRLIRAVWQQLLPWQARTLDVADAPRTPPPVEFDAPRDSVLRVAHAAFARGEYGVATSEAMTRLLFQPRPAQADLRNAMLQSATAFTLRERDAEALSLIADVMEVYPCMTFSTAVPATLREMAEASRKPARCTSIPLAMIALRSAVPGLGQATSPLRTKFGIAVLGGTALSYTVASQLRVKARDEYQRYLDYSGSTPVKPPALFRAAEESRLYANAFTIAAVTIWSGAAVEAVWNEWQHKRALAEVRQVGRPAGARTSSTGGVRWTPLVAPHGLGVAVRF